MSFVNSKDRLYSHNDMEVLNLVSHPIWVFDYVNKKKWWANSAALEFWNARTLDDLTTRSFDDMSETAQRKNMDSLERLKRNESWVESWTFYPLGKPRSVLLSHRGIYTDSGQLCVFVECKDMEENKHGREFLRDATMLRYLPIAVSQFDVNGALMCQNPEACRVFGTPRDSTIDVKHDQDPSSTTTQLPKTNQKPAISDTLDMEYLDIRTSSQVALNSKESIPQQRLDVKKNNKEDDMRTSPSHFLDRFVERSVGLKILEQIQAGNDVNVEALVKTKAGPVWNALHARLGKDAESKDPIILYTARDISDIVKAKKETELNLERAEFFAIMAHEIRTPLFQVTGFIDLLDETSLSREQQNYIDQLKPSLTSLMTVINDVVDYSKLEAGKMKLNIVPFEPRAVLEGSFEVFKPSLEEKGLQFKASFETGIPVELMGDPNRFRQIMLNLLQNAVKFTYRGSIEASVSVVEDDNLGRIVLKIAVKDTGIGIDSDHLASIFRKYNQAEPTIATAYGGTGLGLSICKSLVDSMGGSIGVDSTVGKGSTFWFQIPFTQPKYDAQPPGEDAESKEDKMKFRILVAEDNKVSQKLISKMLSRLGHKATVVENGEEAVKEVQKQEYDLVLMDIQMPVMDGIDATKNIRCLGMTLPIVGLTASVRREDFENIGLNGWIGKPVRLKELQKKIVAAINAPVL